MTTATTPATGWRVVDIVVAAALAVAFGVVFWAWNALWLPLFAGQVNPLAYLVSGMWLVPGVLGMLIIRKPGAAIFTETLAAVVSALLGSVWGLDAVLSGAVQGAGAELVFAALLYRSFSLPVALLAGAGAAIGEWLHDMPVYYAGTAFEVQLAYGVFMLISGVLIAGLGSWLLVRAIAPTGALGQFEAGRAQTEV
ncbi:MAG TPA: ECF transporter S component [Candidatus Limnocylindria bacterium]|nr:ECF transporter S component [Candidatus Limnocylindria bacterium]